MIAIIDYGAGNIKSLQFALNKVGLSSVVTTESNVVQESKAIILPGVGAFNDAMEAIRSLGLAKILKEEAANGKPLLGICLGMQLFYETSYEDGRWEGLGLLKGAVSRITGNVKVPHIGWNTLDQHGNNAILRSINPEAYAYFVHSYAVTDYENQSLVASTLYGGTIPAVVQDKNITGMQFHPEKSGAVGLQLLKNFGEMIR
ncbi:imidazole glycerol phosphate synthase subunit HisH 1 [Oceanobacillus picturae]|uniref:Imidazole glycerol phosphate synthase subunit HisH n=1 Tax=Oceanobacillus picturae TaxID=171693 RepID=W9AEY3_9BACI|nr:imidazole glycerol phosphate synthase subunit HisH [Oceanobacillus picturae]RIU88554.1 imidazole glycerol phosphate synthase subunit HisH [Oceanobacillus picturae]GAQ16606.1 imidazole glycerol phosphate synthase subunit HisH 1 [Oceanobacillus picturae]CDO04033.1 Imidazole glycerol phosphate synthase subunit HisH 1 [Oceanobacillus picturae]